MCFLRISVMLCLVFFVFMSHIQTKRRKREYQLTVSFSLLLHILSTIQAVACYFLLIPFFCQRVAFACYPKLCFFPYAITCQPRKYIIEKKRKRDSRTMAMCASENNCQSQLHALKDKKEIMD